MAALLTQKNFDLSESLSCIDFSELYSMKPKRFVRFIKPKQIRVIEKIPACNYHQLDAEVLVYLNRNHAASDLQLNEKKIEKLQSFLCNLNNVEPQVHGKLDDNVKDQQSNGSITHTKMQHSASDMIVSKVSNIRDPLPLFFEEEETKKSKYDLLNDAGSEISKISVAANQNIIQPNSGDGNEKEDSKANNKDMQKSGVLHEMYKRVVRLLILIRNIH